MMRDDAALHDDANDFSAATSAPGDRPGLQAPIAAIAFALALGFLLAAAGSWIRGALSVRHEAGPFSAALLAAARAHPGRPIDLAALPAPPWDQLYVFAPNTPRDEACDVLELGWLDCVATLPAGFDEAGTELVFRRGGAITGVQWHRPGSLHLEFARAVPMPIRRADAVFSLTAGVRPETLVLAPT
jgi:hypothetical protein